MRTAGGLAVTGVVVGAVLTVLSVLPILLLLPELLQVFGLRG
ncbi:hypothetical protein [Curtobacterium sp. MCJR17_043]|nr:hypothetical protein [Curtobacterium sp. MCJR17_043]WIB36121.1 hypothetical protein DEJ15_02440 [Curtobacterium sp. MCJR17_043]